MIWFWKKIAKIKCNSRNLTFLQGSGSAEFPHDTLDHNYVEQNVFSNTDRFLEDDLFVKDLKTWHVIFFVSAGTLVASIYYENQFSLITHLYFWHMYSISYHALLLCTPEVTEDQIWNWSQCKKKRSSTKL